MHAIKLKFDENGVDFFSQLFFASDHNSDDRSYYGLFQILSMWAAGVYNIYVPFADDGNPMGVCHGQMSHRDFHGHLYFLKEYRKFAGLGLSECVSLCQQEFNPDRLLAYIKEDNKLARVFVRQMGFEKEDDCYILNLKEAS